MIEQIIPLLSPNRQVYFYRTHDGAELDLVITKGNLPDVSIEIKFGSGVSPTRGNTEAIHAFKTHKNYIIIKDEEDYNLSGGSRVCGLNTFLDKYLNI